MSEQDRSSLYTWLREQINEPTAEYLMSCLTPVPASDFATKDFIVKELERYPTKEFLTAELERYPTKEFLTAELERYPTKEFLTAELERYPTKEFLTAELERYPTKEFLTAELERYPTKEFLTAELSRFVTKEEFAQLDKRVAALETKVDHLAAQQTEDRRVSQIRHYWLAGIGLAAVVPIWLQAAGILG